MNNPCRVLIADDSPSLRQLIAEVLVGEGCQTVEASDGQEALEQLQRGEEFHLALVDLNMPRLDGLGVIRALRAHERTRFIPILMVTAESRPDRREAARQAGATGWIAKPVAIDHFVQIVRRLVPMIAPGGAR